MIKKILLFTFSGESFFSMDIESSTSITVITFSSELSTLFKDRKQLITL